MTTNEKLERIKARCQEIIALGERRSWGRWEQDRSLSNEVWSKIGHIAETDEACVYSYHNAAFIAACAGPAEAMAKSTLAAIEQIQTMRQDTPIWDFVGRPLADSILAAWPEELL